MLYILLLFPLGLLLFSYFQIRSHRRRDLAREEQREGEKLDQEKREIEWINQCIDRTYLDNRRAATDLVHRFGGPYDDRVHHADWLEGYPKTRERLREAWDLVRQVHNFQWVDSAARKYRELQNATDPLDRLNRLIALISAYDLVLDVNQERLVRQTGCTRDQVVEQFKQLLSNREFELRSQIQDAETLMAYLSFHREIRELLRHPPVKTIKLPEFPSNWDDLVAKHLDNPSVYDFVRSRELPDGELGLRAVSAIRKPDVTDAKFILAMCAGGDKSAWARTQVTDDLRTRLMEMVEAYNEDHRAETEVRSSEQ